MSILDEMLQAPADAALPPLVRWLKTRLAAGDEVKIELWKSTAVLGSSAVELVIHRAMDGSEQAPQQVAWDDDLNASLVALGVRAVDLENEGERFALGLRAKLRKVERRYGDGYVNSVFVELIDESDLSKGSDVADVRKFVPVNSPDRNGRAYHRCREEIASEIAARAAELREHLKYNEGDLKDIMSKAIARYLDERFSVSRRRALGWL